MDFIDLKTQYRNYQTEIDQAVAKVMASAQFIMGPEVTELEVQLAKFTGVKHAIACSSGTDAILLPLMAWGIGPGDEVIVPDFTFFATAEVVSLLGATPVFADIDPTTWNISPTSVQNLISPRTKGIIAVSLYGQCADFSALQEIANQQGIWLLEDGAQSFGALQNGKRSCSFGNGGTTSFFPAKPLGAYGDGGAFFTNDDILAQQVRSLLNHGQEGRYHHTRIGINGRLDTLQAAVLLVKLKYYEKEMELRNQWAHLYNEQLQGIVRTPFVAPHNTSVWAQYTIAHPLRDQIVKSLAAKGIPSSVHYPSPVHAQPVYAHLPSHCPVAEHLASKVVSLPMHPFLTQAQVLEVCEAVKSSIPS